MGYWFWFWFWMWAITGTALVEYGLFSVHAARAQAESAQRYIDELRLDIKALRDRLESTQGSK